MISNLININKKSFLALILVSVLTFSVMAPTVIATVGYDSEYESKNNIQGDVLDFSNRVKFDFSKSSNRDSYGDLTKDGYEIKKVGHNYTIKFKDLTAKKVILPYDDSDVEVAESSAEKGTDPRTVFPNLQRHLARKTHITIELEGTNKVTGYGITGGYTKGVTIKGTGTLDVQAHLERKTETVHNMNTEQTAEEQTDYIVPGIVLETDKINDNDPDSGFIIEATGKIKINSPYYWGIIVNGDIKFAENSKVEITAEPAGEKRAQSGAISADCIIGRDKLTVTTGEVLEHEKNKPEVSKKENKSITKDTTAPVITAKSSTGEEIKQEGLYCENPVVTVTDNKEIDYIKVNGITITKFKYNSWTEKTFELPTYLDAKKTIVAVDSDGNNTKFEFTSNNGHITLGGEEVKRIYATCTTNGYHEVEYRCRVCNKIVRTEKLVDPALGHSFGNWTYASAVEDKHTCTRCGYTETRDSTEKIANTKVSLSTSNYVYDGTKKEPTVIVKDESKTLVKGQDYTVNYSNNVKAGMATVAITGKNHYTGTITKNFKIVKKNNSITAANIVANYSKKAQVIKIVAKQIGNAKLTYSSNNKNVKVNSSGKVTVAKGFIGKATITITAGETQGYNKASKKITIIVNPPAIKISKLSNTANKKMTIKWNKDKAVTGYQIQYSTDKKFKKNVKTVTVKKNSTTSKSITKLTKNKKYYVRIRSYKTISKVNYYSNWSVKNIKISR